MWVVVQAETPLQKSYCLMDAYCGNKKQLEE